MDTLSIAMINELRAIAKFNHYVALNPNPNLFSENVATGTNSGATTTGFQKTGTNEVLTSKPGLGVVNGRALEIQSTADANSGAMHSSKIEVTGGASYTMFTLVKGSGDFKLLFDEQDVSNTHLAYPTSDILTLNGGYQLLKKTWTLNANTVNLTPWWVRGNVASSKIYIAANVLKQTTY